MVPRMTVFQSRISKIFKNGEWKTVIRGSILNQGFNSKLDAARNPLRAACVEEKDWRENARHAGFDQLVRDGVQQRADFTCALWREAQHFHRANGHFRQRPA